MNIALISLYGVENNGIRSISSVLKANGFHTYLIFFKRWVNNDIRFPSEKEKIILISLLRKINADIIGISFTSPFLGIARDLTTRIKNALPAKVIWGGIHATVSPKVSLEHCDIVCRGEGEYAMLDVAKAVAGNLPLEGIKNICYRQNDKLIFEEMRPLIYDLNLLPNQDYGGDDKFFIERFLINIDPLIYASELRTFASRGCPFNCSYCYNSIFRKLYKDENYHRIKKVETVISEIQHALSKFKRIKKIKFEDDTFIFPKSWIYEFCEKYRRFIGLPFEILFNAECLDQDILKRLKSVGLKRVQVGIQTASQYESEQVYNRKLSLEKIEKFAQVSKEKGLDIVYDVILDNPLACYEDREGLVYFLLSLPRPFNLFIYSLTIFPGTEICEMLLKKGLIKPEEIEGNANKSFYQFRLSLSYPRNKDDLFIACIISLTSKSFIPKSLIIFFMKRHFLRKHPFLLRWIAEGCNYIKLSFILLNIVMWKEFSMWKIREYGSFKKVLIQ